MEVTASGKASEVSCVKLQKRNKHNIKGDVVANFLFQLIFIFPLFLHMVMSANEFKTKEKQKLTATGMVSGENPGNEVGMVYSQFE